MPYSWWVNNPQMKKCLRAHVPSYPSYPVFLLVGFPRESPLGTRKPRSNMILFICFSPWFLFVSHVFIFFQLSLQSCLALFLYCPRNVGRGIFMSRALPALTYYLPMAILLPVYLSPAFSPTVVSRFSYEIGGIIICHTHISIP